MLHCEGDHVSEAPTDRTFGELLAAYRRAARLSGAELARRSELSPRSIRYLENGAHQPYADTIHRLAAALELSEADRVRLERAARPTDRRPGVSPGREEAAGSPGPVPAAGETRPHNLPARLTSFIGREQEREDLDALLGEARLVTLTGAGGIGKTRLALELAAGRVDAYPDGVWLVELAGVSDPRMAPEAVAGVLVRHEQGRRAALDWLADGRVRVADLYQTAPPADAQRVYQELLRQEWPALGAVFQWR
jgi:transcriptional regulator with XRE-family HTH domain